MRGKHLFLHWSNPCPSIQPSPIGPAPTHSAQSLHTCSLITLRGGDRDCSGAGSCGAWGLLSWTLGGWRPERPGILRADTLPASRLPRRDDAPASPPAGRPGPSAHRDPPQPRGLLPPPALLCPAGAPSLPVGRVKTLLLSRKRHYPDTPPLRLPPLALKLLLEVPAAPLPLGSRQVQVQVPWGPPALVPRPLRISTFSVSSVESPPSRVLPPPFPSLFSVLRLPLPHPPRLPLAPTLRPTPTARSGSPHLCPCLGSECRTPSAPCASPPAPLPGLHPGHLRSPSPQRPLPWWR